MKKKFTKLFAALALLVFITPKVGWGQTKDDLSVTMQYTGTTTQNMTGNNDAALVNLSATEWSVIGAKGSASNFPGLNQNGSIRLYYHANGSNTITVTNSLGYTITSIVVTYKAEANNNGTITVGGTQVSGSGTSTVKTYEINATSFVIGNGYSSNTQVHITSIVMNYSTGSASICATPTFDPEEGTYYEAQSVTITSATEEATIYYTLDGNDPTTSSSVYSSAISITETTTVKAMAVKTDYDNSAIASATYTINEPSGETWSLVTSADDLVAGDTYVIACNTQNKVAGDISSQVMASLAATFSTDKTTITVLPEEAVVLTLGVDDSNYTFTNSNQLLGCTAVKKLAWDNGTTTWSISFANNTMTMSSTESSLGSMKYNSGSPRFTTYASGQVDIQLYRLTGGTSTCATPTFSPAAGTYDATQSVTITSATEGATIYYTLDGNDPTTSSSVYSEALTISETTTVKAMAVKEDYDNSAVATALYTIVPPAVATPTFSPAAGVYTSTQNVTIACTTDGATIQYKLTENGEWQSYTEALPVSETTTVWAKATKSGMTDSEVATAAYVILEHAGTEADPYSVADARAAIDAGTGVTGVYATGIVSEIVTEYNSQYSNITFDIVDAEGDEVSLRAYRCGGSEAANVAVGDVVVVSGDLTKYQQTYEFGQGCQLVSLEHPVITTPTITVAPTSVNAPFAGAEGTLTVTYENITEIVAEVYFCNAAGEAATYDWITAEINNENNVEYLIAENDGEARTAYLKVYALDDDSEDVYSNLVTFTQEEYVAPTYAELPFEFDGGKSDIESTDGLYQEGLGSDYNNSPKLKFDNTSDWLLLQFEERPGTLSFTIKGNGYSSGSTSTFKVQTSTNGTSFTDLATYTELGDAQNESFDNLSADVRYIRWIYIEKGATSGGNVALGNIVLDEYVEPVLVASITVDPDLVELNAEEHDGTLGLTYENLEISDMTDFDIQYYDAEGEEVETVPEWIEVLVAEQDPEVGEGYVVSYYMLENEGAARTAYFKVWAVGDEDYVYSNLVTVNQAAYVAPAEPGDWVLCNLADLTEDDVFVIVGTDGDGETFALPYDGGSSTAPSATAITIVEGAISGEPDETLQWNLSGNDADGYTFYPNGDTEKWLYCTNANNGVRVGTNENKIFKMDDDGYMVNDATNRVLSIFVNSGTPQDWRCYGNYNNNPVVISLYKKVDAPVTETYTLEINGYNHGGPDWYLIASPVTTTPEDAGMITDELENGFEPEDATYDLYYFNQSQVGAEWRNYRAAAFDLIPGKGYLYANRDDVTLTFTGTPYDGEGTVDLDYDNDGTTFAGWNLIGNPYSTEATVEQDYYTLNERGSELAVGVGSTVAAMQGIFVYAEEPGQNVTFVQESRGSKGNVELNGRVVLNLNGNNGVIDRAIVRFGEGRQLPKFQLNPNSTKLYIPQGNKDYAVVRSANEGEMPVNFKASANGTYTINVNAENTEMNYLHLVDNMTGADVDLLANPSYSFEAKTTDYASRFKLVFKAGTGIDENTTTASFAFFNGDSWTVSNQGEATLQVIDMMGRVLSSKTVNGNATINVNETAGVYMLRLVNGNSVKVQKVVVK